MSLLLLLGKAAVLLIHLDHHARHRLSVTADVLDVLIDHRIRFLTEQSRQRAIEIGSGLGSACSTYSMGIPCELDADVRDALECARSAPTLCRRADDDERGCGVTPTPERVT